MDSLIELLTYLYCGLISVFVWAFIKGSLRLIKFYRNNPQKK